MSDAEINRLRDSIDRLVANDSQHGADIAAFRVQFDAVESRLSRIESDLKAINANTGWIVKLIIGGFVLAVMGFALQGGFHVSGG